MTTTADFQLDEPPDGLDGLADALAVCGGMQAAIAIETAFDRLLHDLPWRLSRADYADAAAEVVVLLRLSVRARKALVRGGASGARRIVSSIWSWYSGALLWDELMQLLAELLGHTVIGDSPPMGPGVLELEPWDGTLASILGGVPDDYADQLADNAQRFITAWWTRLCQRLAFRDALTVELE